MENSAFEVESAVGFSNPYVSSASEDTSRPISLEEIANAMFEAWMEHGETRLVTSHFFTTEELYAMHRAWTEVTRGRPCDIEQQRIAETLADLIEHTMIQDPLPIGSYLVNMSYFRTFNAEKCLIVENLLREWERITEGREFVGWNNSEIENSQNSVQMDIAENFGSRRNFWLRISELYAKVHLSISDSRYQFLLQSLLIIWPISLAIIGFRYMECSTSHYAPYFFMALGAIGCIVVFVRLALMFSKQAENPQEWSKAWTGLRLIEMCFIVVYIIQINILFNGGPPSKTGPNHCDNFFHVAMRTNYVSVVLVAVYFLLQIYKCIKRICR